MNRRERKSARVRRCAGRGALGESGEKRKWRFCFADLRAVEERMLALASVLDSDVEAGIEDEVIPSADPLEGDMLFLQLCYLEL